MSQTSLLAELRRRIKDVRYSHRAFGLAVTDTAVTSAITEITGHRLMVTVSGGTAPSLDFDLTNPRYDTVGKLTQVLGRTAGYRCSIDEDVNLEQVSVDLEPFGPFDIKEVGLDFKHHLFSDSELEDFLRQAIQRHNPGFSLVNIPPQEQAFVLPLAQALICRAQAYDSSKRKGLDVEVSLLIQLADSFESQYRDDTSRLKRAIQSPKEANPNLMGEGDTVLGHLFRRSLRTGFNAPMGMNLPPDPAVLLEPDERDAEDESIRVTWQRNRDLDFYSYELWMDTRPDVQRIREGLIFTSTPFSFLSNDQSLRSASERVTTSQLVFRSFGANSNFDTTSFATFVEEFGQLIKSFIVGKLEPLTTYYFRLYIVDLNYETVGSNVVAVKTKALRVKFPPKTSAVVACSPTYGPAGTTVTVNFDSTKGQFTTATQLLLGGKEVTATIVNPFKVTFVVPTFVNGGGKDLTVVSTNQLIDVRHNVFTVNP